MSDRFERQAELVPRERLESLTIDVIGVGAIGRQVALQLAAMGARSLRLFDPDHVEETNITTQAYWTADLGLPKVQACQRAMAGIDPEARVVPIADRYRLRHGVSEVVFCGVDSISARAAIWRSVKNRSGFWCDGRMLGEVIRILAVAGPGSAESYQQSLFVQEEAQSGRCTARSTIYAAGIAAGLMVHQFTRWLRGIPVEGDAVLNLLTMEWIPVQS